MDNNQDTFYKVIAKAKEVRLTEAERNALFLAVDTFVAKNPLQASVSGVEAVGQVTEPTKAGFISVKPLQTFINFWDLYGMRVGVAFMAVLLVGGTTSVAAQKALPGDFLYPVRVNFNEGVKAVFMTDARRAEYQLERVMNRVEEAQILAAEDRLSDEAKESLLSKLSGHLSVAEKNFNHVANRGDLKSVFEIGQTIEETIGASQGVISGIAAHSVSQDVKLVSIKDALEHSREASMLALNDVENKIYSRDVEDEDTRVLAEAKSNSVKKSLQTIEKKMVFEEKDLITSSDTARLAKGGTGGTSGAMMMSVTADPVSGSHAADIAEDNAETVKKVKDLMTEGEMKFNMGKYKEAFVIFKKAHDISKSIQIEVDLENAGIQNELNSVILDLNQKDITN